MRIAIVCSNYLNMGKETASGTGIFNYSFISELVKHAENDLLSITAFASGASQLPVQIESIDYEPSSANDQLSASGKFVLYEQALIAKAFAMQDRFDLYHINIGDGDIALPFSPFVKRPILITLHHILDTDYMRTFFSFYKNVQHVRFVSASNAQRKLLPDLNYAATIYHGVDPALFAFNTDGGASLMWAGRVIPEKGPDIVVDIAQQIGCAAKLFGIPRKQHQKWFETNVLDKINESRGAITYEAGLDRYQLVDHYQSSKAFVLPIVYEESFGLVLIEAMSCGTPVIAFARGSIPEIIEDGKTGFIVNAADDDIRGDWIVKKTGGAGLREAVERIYAMPPTEYAAMRAACRDRVLRYFTIKRMVDEYLHVYKESCEISTLNH